MTGEAAIRLNEYSEVKESIYGNRVRSSDMMLTGLIYGCTAVSMLILVGILGYTFARGIPHVTWSFLSTASSAVKGTFGILGNIINTIYIVVITLLIATPIGVGSAIYLNEYAKPGKIVRMIEFTTETLSGIPSIIFGLFGMVFFGNLITLGMLVVMLLPYSLYGYYRNKYSEEYREFEGKSLEEWYGKKYLKKHKELLNNE